MVEFSSSVRAGLDPEFCSHANTNQPTAKGKAIPLKYLMALAPLVMTSFLIGRSSTNLPSLRGAATTSYTPFGRPAGDTLSPSLGNEIQHLEDIRRQLNILPETAFDIGDGLVQGFATGFQTLVEQGKNGDGQATDSDLGKLIGIETKNTLNQLGIGDLLTHLDSLLTALKADLNGTDELIKSATTTLDHLNKVFDLLNIDGLSDEAKANLKGLLANLGESLAKLPSTIDAVKDASLQVGDASNKVGNASNKVGAASILVSVACGAVIFASLAVAFASIKVGSASDKVGNASDKVGDASDKVGNTSDKVGDASDQVGFASTSVLSASVRVGNASDKVGGAADSVNEAAASVKDIIDALTDLIATVKDSASEEAITEHKDKLLSTLQNAESFLSNLASITEQSNQALKVGSHFFGIPESQDRLGEIATAGKGMRDGLATALTGLSDIFKEESSLLDVFSRVDNVLSSIENLLGHGPQQEGHNRGQDVAVNLAARAAQGATTAAFQTTGRMIFRGFSSMLGSAASASGGTVFDDARQEIESTMSDLSGEIP